VSNPASSHKPHSFVGRHQYHLFIMSNNNSTVIKVGIIGTGIFAYRHLRAYQAVGQFQIVACANRSLEKAQKFAKEASKPPPPFLHHTLTHTHTHSLSLF
jgi:predicted homoserine dehydrogenase-like protein